MEPPAQHTHVIRRCLTRLTYTVGSTCYVGAYLSRLAPAPEFLHLLDLFDLIERGLGRGGTHRLLCPIVHQFVQLVCECALPRGAVFCGIKRVGVISSDIFPMSIVDIVHYLHVCVKRRNPYLFWPLARWCFLGGGTGASGSVLHQKNCLTAGSLNEESHIKW